MDAAYHNFYYYPKECGKEIADVITFKKMIERADNLSEVHVMKLFEIYDPMKEKINRRIKINFYPYNSRDFCKFYWENKLMHGNDFVRLFVMRFYDELFVYDIPTSANSVYTYIILLCDNYFFLTTYKTKKMDPIMEEYIEIINRRIKSFFRITTKLPLELQGVIANRVEGITTDFIDQGVFEKLLLKHLIYKNN